MITSRRQHLRTNQNGSVSVVRHHNLKYQPAMTWKEARKKMPWLRPRGDVDHDGVKNSKDCRPLNPKMHTVKQLDTGKFEDEKGVFWSCPNCDNIFRTEKGYDWHIYNVRCKVQSREELRKKVEKDLKKAKFEEESQ